MARTVEEIKGWLKAYMTRVTGAKEVSETTTFTRQGLDSVTAVAMTADLELFIEHKLPPSLPYDYPTIEEIANLLGLKQAEAVDGMNDQQVDEMLARILRHPGEVNDA